MCVLSSILGPRHDLPPSAHFQTSFAIVCFVLLPVLLKFNQSCMFTISYNRCTPAPSPSIELDTLANQCLLFPTSVAFDERCAQEMFSCQCALFALVVHSTANQCSLQSIEPTGHVCQLLVQPSINHRAGPNLVTGCSVRKTHFMPRTDFGPIMCNFGKTWAICAIRCKDTRNYQGQ